MKSRMLWLSYGDANTHFFHVQAKIKRARQHIANLKDESEEWLWGSNLHNHVINHIQCLFQSGMSTASLPPPQTLFSSSDFDPQAMCDTLIHFPDKEEICAALFTIHPLKSPGPQRGWKKLILYLIQTKKKTKLTKVMTFSSSSQ